MAQVQITSADLENNQVSVTLSGPSGASGTLEVIANGISNQPQITYNGAAAVGAGSYNDQPATLKRRKHESNSASMRHRSGRANGTLRCKHSQRAQPVGRRVSERDAVDKSGHNKSQPEKVFEAEGGLAEPSHRTYVYRHCPYFKVDVDFSPAPRPQSNEGDTITKISTPYIAWTVGD